jgi:hypothetical protein
MAGKESPMRDQIQLKEWGQGFTNANESKARPQIFSSLSHREPEWPPMEAILTWWLLPGFTLFKA